MKKARIILAGKEEKLLHSLLVKFIREYSDRILPELFTRKDCFRKLLESPQKTDLLIIGGEFYDSRLRHHEIGGLYILADSENETGNPDLTMEKNRVMVLPKSSGAQVIFRTVIGQNRDLFSSGPEDFAAGKVILVSSAKGGSGTTTVSRGISAVLSSWNKKVLFLTADWMPSDMRAAGKKSGIQNPELAERLLLLRNISSEEFRKDTGRQLDLWKMLSPLVREEGFFWLEPFQRPLVCLGLNLGVYEQIILAARNFGNFDYIILDTNPSFDEYKVRMLELSDRGILVYRNGGTSRLAVDFLRNYLDEEEQRPFLLVHNEPETGSREENALVLGTLEKLETKHLALSPDLRKIAALVL